MTPSFTRGEYWLLEAAVQYRLPIAVVASDDADVYLNKRAGHGLTRPELCETFMNLVGRRLIEAKELDGPCFIPGAREVAALIEGKGKTGRGLWYGLTAEGGRQWEVFARPDWDHYIGVTGENMTSDGWEDIEYVSGDIDRLRRYYFLAGKAMKNVDESSARWDTVQPWQATYWKTLALGHRVRFRGTSEFRLFPPDLRSLMFNMNRWYAWG